MPHPNGGATHRDEARHGLQDACTEVLLAHRTHAYLTALLDGLPGDDPGREAVAHTAGLLRRRWLDQVAGLCALPAVGPAALLLKAAVVSRLVERDEADQVVGCPCLALAASLADDILAQADLR